MDDHSKCRWNLTKGCPNPLTCDAFGSLEELRWVAQEAHELLDPIDDDAERLRVYREFYNRLEAGR